MSSNNKESLNDMVNRLTLENEQLKRVSVEAFIEHLVECEKESTRLGDKTCIGDSIIFAKQFLKNRSV